MRLKGTIVFLVILTSAMMVLISCGGKATKDVEEPEWVIKGSGAFEGESGRVFYGVGAASGIRNKALARTTSDNRARAEVQKIFQTYSASLMKDYMASTTAGDMSATSEEQHVEQAVKTFSAGTLSGVEIVNHWTDPSDGTIYALARLNIDYFKDALNKMKDLDAEVRDYVRRNAERSFDELAAEEAKAH